MDTDTAEALNKMHDLMALNVKRFEVLEFQNARLREDIDGLMDAVPTIAKLLLDQSTIDHARLVPAVRDLMATCIREKRLSTGRCLAALAGMLKQDFPEPS